jgi:polyhydroxyalkanoate synthesis regulator phasin
MAQEAWRAYLELAYGMTEATTKKATKTVRRLVGKSGATAEQLQAMAEDLLEAGSNNREALTKLVRYELDRALGAVGLATADEVSALTTRVHELEAQLKAASTPSPVLEPVHEPAPPVGAEVIASAPAAPPVPTTVPATAAAPAKKAAAKKTVAQKAVVPPPPPAKQVPVKKSGPAKQAAAKAAVEKIAEASEVGPASAKLPVKKSLPRKRAAS